MTAPLIIRADASAAIGTGHVMRCLALAQAFRRTGGRAIFAQAETTPALEQRLRREQCEIVPLETVRGSAADADRTVKLAREYGAKWVVADGYCFDADWQRQIRDAGLRLLVIDDYGQATHYHADVVLNQNLSAEASLYSSCDPDTRLLLGPRYALLRQEFLAADRPVRDFARPARRVLVTLGGSDPDCITAQVITALKTVPGIEAVVVIGGSNPHFQALQAMLADDSPIRLVVDVANMPDLMAWADVAVTAAGSTSWELAAMGLPALQLILAENQKAIAEALHREGVTVNMGDFHEVKAETIAAHLGALLDDAPRRGAMSARGIRLVDGHGASRVAAAVGGRLALTLVSDANSWINEFLGGLKTEFEAVGHQVRWIHDPCEIETGDVAFMLSLSRIVPPPVLRRSAHNLVVHESALPHGRGWSPLTWQVLEGKTEIPISLIEAAESVDSGEIYAQQTLQLRGHELIGELRAAQARATIDLCRDFVARYPSVCTQGRAQIGASSYYPRRSPEDSRIDPEKSVREQFNLLRVADPERYPAFFEIDGRRFELRLTVVPGNPSDVLTPSR